MDWLVLSDCGGEEGIFFGGAANERLGFSGRVRFLGWRCDGEGGGC